MPAPDPAVADTAEHDLAVVVPLRSFSGPKTRLSEALSPAERSELTRELAAGVLDALTGWPVYVVSDDHEVGSWARARGASVVVPPTPGLDVAADAGRDAVRSAGHARCAVVHADLADPGALGAFLRSTAEHTAEVVGITDRHADGTNVLVVPVAVAFGFAYGPGSFDRHRAEAARLGLGFRAVAHHDLRDDVDTVEDLARYRSQANRPPSA